MQLGVEFVDLTAVSIPVELVSYVPKNIAKKFCVVRSSSSRIRCTSL